MFNNLWPSYRPFRSIAEMGALGGKLMMLVLLVHNTLHTLAIFLGGAPTSDGYLSGVSKINFTMLFVVTHLAAIYHLN